MGRRDRRALESSYRLLISHLLKWEFQPQLRTPAWEITIARERTHIEQLERQSPSLERQAAAIVEGVYRRARKEAEIETGLPRSTFPPQIPYTLEELRDDDWMPA